MIEKFALQADALDESRVRASVDAANAGAVVTFVGRVRSFARGHEVTKLEYEAYPEMVLRVFEQIGDEARGRFSISDIAVHHRTGTLEVGETSVIIVVTAPHRDAAFDAARYAIDRLKQIAPIWKKETSPDDSVWVDDRP
jgi:molybdopterin synthase catalytic subunit